MNTIMTNVRDFIECSTMENFCKAFIPDPYQVSEGYQIVYNYMRPFSPDTAIQHLQDVFFEMEKLEDMKSRIDVQLAIIRCMRTVVPANKRLIQKMLQRIINYNHPINT